MELRNLPDDGIGSELAVAARILESLESKLGALERDYIEGRRAFPASMSPVADSEERLRRRFQAKVAQAEAEGFAIPENYRTLVGVCDD